ncbi:MULTISPECIES: hypothetical protein [unclassified Streptomyces]|uniref:hypothetical protein n=1 Tax=unclassified Streptomyces TaxID=2593676 RepID=UPI00278C1DED|nr:MULTISPECIES: hypothetical protein [unclassified Streptomyces]
MTVPRRKKPTSAPAEPVKCSVCKGSGEVSVSVRVGRKRETTDAQQTGLCLACLGSGEAARN